MSRAWVVGLLVIASALRLAALGRQSFWYDEAVSVALASHPVADLLSGRVGDLGNPPLYPALLRVWTLGFGNGDAAVRALSAVLGIATVPLVYAVGRRILGVGAALAGTLLFCLAPFHLQMAQEARTYTLLTLAGVASVYALLRALEQPQRWSWWIGLGPVGRGDGPQPLLRPVPGGGRGGLRAGGAPARSPGPGPGGGGLRPVGGGVLVLAALA